MRLVMYKTIDKFQLAIAQVDTLILKLKIE